MGNKAQTGGILTIISGGIGILESLAFLAFIPMIRTAMTDANLQTDPNLTQAELEAAADFAVGFITFFGIVGILLSVFVIVAGAMATRRKAWGLGLAGSIVSVFLFFPTAIPAIIFMALAKPEFEPKAIPSAAIPQQALYTPPALPSTVIPPPTAPPSAPAA
jgi:hypothetical protein